MNNIPSDIKYTKDHEWLKIEGDHVIVGITHHAQGSLGDITFVELPAIGNGYAAGETFGVVESVKAASDLYMPIAGEVIAINDSLERNPECVNESPYNEGWMIKVKPLNLHDVERLLTADQYKKLL